MNKLQMLGLTLVCIGGLNGAAAGGAPTGAVYPYDCASFGPYHENPDQFMRELNIVLYDDALPKGITPEQFTYILNSIHDEEKLANRSVEGSWRLLLGMTVTQNPERYVTEENLGLLDAIGSIPPVEDVVVWNTLAYALRRNPACINTLRTLRPNAQLEEKDGLTVLREAISGDCPECIRTLCAAGVDVNQQQEGHIRVLTQAALIGRKEIVQILIAAGANLDARDGSESSGTALGHALMFGHKEVVQLLVTAGANVNLRYQCGETALKIAMESEGGCREEMMRILIKAGANVGLQDVCDHTVLWHAAHLGHANIVQMLVAVGANPNDELNDRHRIKFAQEIADGLRARSAGARAAAAGGVQ